MQTGWSGDPENYGVKKLYTPGTSAITVSLNARPHLEDLELRVDDSGRQYPGYGAFEWQLCEAKEGRAVMGFKTKGAMVQALPKYSYDNQGNLKDIAPLSELELFDMWQKIKLVLGDESFGQRVVTLRKKLESVPMVRPGQYYSPRPMSLRERMKIPGFKGFWLDLEQIPLPDSEISKDLAQPFSQWDFLSGFVQKP